MILSILIPTIKGRERQFNELEDFIQWQIGQANLWDEVEIQSICDNKEITIGAKRNKLLELANGDYCVMIDDDDTLHFQFIARIMEAIKEKPDCIGYKELCIYEGKGVKSSDISLKHNTWQDARDIRNGYTFLPSGFNHVRSPFYKAPIKTELCRKVGFKDLRYEEDRHFSRDIYPLLKTEVYIDEFMYHYRYKHEDHKIKYGIK